VVVKYGLWTDAAKQANKPVILKLNDYETLGGWDNTLSNHADEAFAELDEKQQMIAEAMFRSLTERSGTRCDTRRPVSLQTVAAIAGVGIEQVIPVIEVFRRADRSFVMPLEGQPLTAETLIDISHESLIRQWQRMKLWVEQEAQSAEIYRRLEQTALLHQKKQAELYRGLELARAVDWKKREKPSAAWASRYGQEFDRAMRFLATSERLKQVKYLFLSALFLTGMYWGWVKYGGLLFNYYQEEAQIAETTELVVKLLDKRYQSSQKI